MLEGHGERRQDHQSWLQDGAFNYSHGKECGDGFKSEDLFIASNL